MQSFSVLLLIGAASAVSLQTSRRTLGNPPDAAPSAGNATGNATAAAVLSEKAVGNKTDVGSVVTDEDLPKWETGNWTLCHCVTKGVPLRYRDVHCPRNGACSGKMPASAEPCPKGACDSKKEASIGGSHTAGNPHEEHSQTPFHKGYKRLDGPQEMAADAPAEKKEKEAPAKEGKDKTVKSITGEA